MKKRCINPPGQAGASVPVASSGMAGMASGMPPSGGAPSGMAPSARAPQSYDHDLIWGGINTYENTIFSGMNIHLPAILGFTRGTRFWLIAILTQPMVTWDLYFKNPPSSGYDFFHHLKDGLKYEATKK